MRLGKPNATTISPDNRDFLPNIGASEHRKRGAVGSSSMAGDVGRIRRVSVGASGQIAADGDSGDCTSSAQCGPVHKPDSDLAGG